MTWYSKTRVSMCDRMESASRGSKSTDGLSPFCHRKCNKNESRCPFLTRVAIYMELEILNYLDLRFGTNKCFHFQEKISVRYFGVYDSTSWLRAGGERPLVGASDGSFLFRLIEPTRAPFHLELSTQMIWIAGW